VERFKIIPKNKLNTLPKTAGVYVFFTKNLKLKIKNLKLECIYIGKAINIQSRVKNHFQQPSYRDNLFMDKVEKVGYFETGSEIEALVLEANLIKKHQPRFNVVWRDDKNYFYVAVTKDQRPIVYITHQPFDKAQGKQNEKAKYVGPFVEGTALKMTLRFLRKAFPYYTSKKHPKTKCTYCHLGLCPGPELFENPPSPKASEGLREYRRNIKKLILILEGKRNAVLNSLKREMKNLSKESKFEEAAKVRDQILSLQQVMSHAGVIEQEKIKSNSLAIQKSRDSVNYAEVNLGWEKTQNILRGLLDLDKKISKIECYDVSNIQGKHATGSMVVFVNGKADKNQYRKFKIKGAKEPNDIAMLKETIGRRLFHKEWQYPEVMLIDGGIAQLNVAINAKNINPDTRHIKIISIAKRNKDLYIEGKKDYIPLKSLPREIYNLILQLDDEAHRFAISYHKKLRKKDLLR
jgi:excinuclease ABC subunit C